MARYKVTISALFSRDVLLFALGFLSGLVKIPNRTSHTNPQRWWSVFIFVWSGCPSSCWPSSFSPKCPPSATTTSSCSSCGAPTPWPPPASSRTVKQKTFEATWLSPPPTRSCSIDSRCVAPHVALEDVQTLGGPDQPRRRRPRHRVGRQGSREHRPRQGLRGGVQPPVQPRRPARNAGQKLDNLASLTCFTLSTFL